MKKKLYELKLKNISAFCGEICQTDKKIGLYQDDFLAWLSAFLNLRRNNKLLLSFYNRAHERKILHEGHE